MLSYITSGKYVESLSDETARAFERLWTGKADAVTLLENNDIKTDSRGTSRTNPLGLNREIRVELREKLQKAKSIDVKNEYHAPNSRERKIMAKNLLGKGFSIELPDVGTVWVTKTSMKESFAHSSYDEKLNVVPHLRGLLENAVLLGSLDDFGGDGRNNIYLASRIMQDGEPKYVFFRIEDTKNGKPRLYVHDVYAENLFGQEKTDAVKHGAAKAGEPQSIGLAQRILQSIVGVNDEGSLCEPSVIIGLLNPSVIIWFFGVFENLGFCCQ